MFAPYSNLEATHHTASYKDSKVSALRLGYSIDHVVPRQRQKRDVDAEADCGEEAVQKPANHLETLWGPRPSIHPGGLGKDQLISAAASHGRRASHPLTETVHLDRTGGEQTSQVGEKACCSAFKTSIQAIRHHTFGSITAMHIC